MSSNGNTLYEDKLFNPEVKGKFIAGYSSGTSKTPARLFKISAVLEEDLGKDLYEFTRDELKRLFYYFAPTTEYASKANVSWIDKYIQWAINQGFAAGISPLEGVSTEWKQQFAVSNLKQFWTTNELNKIVDGLTNAQDAATVELIRAGLDGEEFSEITSLKLDQFKQGNIIKAKGRDIVISDRCWKVCHQAAKETDYAKMLGNPSPDTKAPSAALVDNNYVIKSAKTRTTHFGEAESNIVYRRLTKISKLIKEPGFNPKAIRYSGMLEMAKKSVDEHGAITDEAYDEIFKQFNESSLQKQRRWKKDFLNEDKVKELYKTP